MKAEKSGPNGSFPLLGGRLGWGVITFNKACPLFDVFTPSLALPLKEGGNVRACRLQCKEGLLFSVGSTKPLKYGVIVQSDILR
jgi:hypothetical protein